MNRNVKAVPSNEEAVGQKLKTNNLLINYLIMNPENW